MQRRHALANFSKVRLLTNLQYKIAFFLKGQLSRTFKFVSELTFEKFVRARCFRVGGGHSQKSALQPFLAGKCMSELTFENFCQGAALPCGRRKSDGKGWSYR